MLLRSPRTPLLIDDLESAAYIFPDSSERIRRQLQHRTGSTPSPTLPRLPAPGWKSPLALTFECMMPDTFQRLTLKSACSFNCHYISTAALRVPRPLAFHLHVETSCAYAVESPKPTRVDQGTRGPECICGLLGFWASTAQYYLCTLRLCHVHPGHGNIPVACIRREKANRQATHAELVFNPLDGS